MGRVCRNALILFLLAIAGRAEDQAGRLYQEGLRAERQGDILHAYLLYVRAAELDPKNLAIAEHKSKAGALAAGTAVIHDANTEPDPDLAFEELMRTQGPGQLDTFGPSAPAPHLAWTGTKKSFDLKGDATSVFKQAGDAFGIQMLFDPDYLGPASVLFRTGDLDMFQAFRLLEQMTAALVEPVGPHTALVTRDTPQRRAEAAPVVTAGIPIPERFSVQDAQELLTAVQQVLEIRRAAVDPARHMVFLRDSVAKIAIGRQLFSDLCRLRSQVAIEVELLAVSKNSNTSIGFTLPNSSALVNFGNFLQNQISPGGFANFLTFGGGRTLFGLGVTAAQAFATVTKSSTESLLKAQILAVDGQAASLNVGERYPIATAQYLGATGPTLTTPTPTVTYQDIGLTMKITPTVLEEGETALDIDAAFTTLGATAANGIPAISQRKFQGKVRLHPEEWAVVAGLTQTNDARTTGGIAGLAGLPLIGHLFRNETIEKDSDQTLIVIKPHVVNLPPWEFPVGTRAVGTESKFISMY